MRAQGSDQVAALASQTLGALVHLDSIRGALLRGSGSTGGVQSLVQAISQDAGVAPGASDTLMPTSYSAFQ